MTAALFGFASAAAQPAAPSPDVPLPPPEVLHCVRPFASSVDPEIPAPQGFSVSLDSSGKARLALGPITHAATCYVVFRTPSDRAPLFLEWSADGLSIPDVLVDDSGFPSSGEYCYELIVGAITGRSPGARSCIEVPASMAPTPTATPIPQPTPVPPSSPGFPEPTGIAPSPAPLPPIVGNSSLTGAPASPWMWLLVALVIGLLPLPLVSALRSRLHRRD